MEDNNVVNLASRAGYSGQPPFNHGTSAPAYQPGPTGPAPQAHQFPQTGHYPYGQQARPAAGFGQEQPNNFYPAQRLDRPADSAEQPAAGGGGRGTGLVPAQPRRLRRRPTVQRPVDPAAELVRRAERRERQMQQATGVCKWLVTRGWWVIRGLGVTVRAVWRIVWQPEQAALIKAMDNADTKPLRRKELRRERAHALIALVVVGTGVYVAGRIWGDDLVAWLEWWAYPIAGVITLPSLAIAGRPEPSEDESAEDFLDEMPRSLSLEASDRGVTATLNEAFKELNIRARVPFPAKRAAAGWGWTVKIEVLDPITEARLEGLERQLNTPVGGLVLSSVSSAARLRELRIVMVDLLTTPAFAPQREPQSVRQPVELATRFDGGRLELSLYVRHILLVGRTRSGKSGWLHVLLDAFTSMPDMAVLGLDLAGGPDLRAWEASLEELVSGPDYVAADRMLTKLVTLIKGRTQRLGDVDHVPTPDDPGIVVLIDEYGIVAEHPRLRAKVEYIFFYGAKAGVFAVAATQRKVKEVMGSAAITSQAHLKIYLGMSAEDAEALPKSLREQGVRPQNFQPANDTTPNDAGKAFLEGLEPLPILCRSDTLDRAEASRRSAMRAASRPVLSAVDQALIAEQEVEGVPQLLMLVRDAIVATASAAGRTPERASGEEICTYLGQRGHGVDKNALLKELRTVSGGLVNRSRDTNLAPGSNPKGFYLDDIDQAVATMRERTDRDAEAAGGGSFA